MYLPWRSTRTRKSRSVRNSTFLNWQTLEAIKRAMRPVQNKKKRKTTWEINSRERDIFCQRTTNVVRKLLVTALLCQRHGNSGVCIRWLLSLETKSSPQWEFRIHVYSWNTRERFMKVSSTHRIQPLPDGNGSMPKKQWRKESRRYDVDNRFTVSPRTVTSKNKGRRWACSVVDVPHASLVVDLNTSREDYAPLSLAFWVHHRYVRKKISLDRHAVVVRGINSYQPKIR